MPNENPGERGDEAVTLLDDTTRAMQAITAEVNDYTQRFVEDTTATFSEVVRAKSVQDAFSRLAAFNKRSMEDYLQQFSRLSNMYVSLMNQQTSSAQSLMVLPGSRT